MILAWPSSMRKVGVVAAQMVAVDHGLRGCKHDINRLRLQIKEEEACLLEIRDTAWSR